ncbi:hypothetical protein OYT88_19540 [Sporolactobacillus sp. CQH2019]|uniref:MutS-related protein n=1 Tax=Sporolactobacillus sp. CQH2019 TaxID=3023512 RepID=UPI0023685F3E|nr:hypothetical protein [Sporolactobacillus sp. CQH2019]MDD9150725.1 hypothetical protein [Sporolactobacillus sp. CQH2019]
MLTSLLFPFVPPPPLCDKTADVYTDLHLDQLFGQIQKQTAHPILDFFYQPVEDAKTIRYRQAVFSDFKEKAIAGHVAVFEQKMTLDRTIREQLRHSYLPELQGYQLVTTLQHNQSAIDRFLNDLTADAPKSRGLKALIDFLKTYVCSEKIIRLRSDIHAIMAGLKALRYRIVVNGQLITVAKADHSNPGLNESLRKAFSTLLNDPPQALNLQEIKPLQNERGVNNLQAMILHALSQLFPRTFKRVRDFYNQYCDDVDPVLERVTEELNFYLAVNNFERQIAESLHVRFTAPAVAAGDDEFVHDSFDIELAAKLAGSATPLITNDYLLKSDEDFIIISGPNQGGKTTFSRMAGENYYLFSLGMPIPGSSARLSIRPHVLTHFQRQESAEWQTGLLAADIDRLQAIVKASDRKSFVIMNELFSSTTAQDAEKMGTYALRMLREKGAHGIYVTFLESLSRLPGTVPMMSQVAADSSERTFKVIRARLNGQAYAISLLDKYHLTADQVKGRIRHESLSLG